MADLKATRCGELPKNEFSPQTEQLISLLERRGIVEDHSIVNEKARQAEQALRRNMYHNTQMMLKHYRDIVWALECFPEQVAEELDRPLKDLDALLSMVDTQLAMGNTRLEHPDAEYQAVPAAAGPDQRCPDGTAAEAGERRDDV